ncbi:hypothetical protein [Actinophytocola sediminis]
MMGGDQFKIVFDTMETAKADLQQTASQHTQSAGDQLNRMMATRDGDWFDQAADESAQMYQYAQKQAGDYADQMTAEGVSYGNVADHGMNTLATVKGIIGRM